MEVQVCQLRVVSTTQPSKGELDGGSGKWAEKTMDGEKDKHADGNE